MDVKFQINDDLKIQFEEICDELGIDPTTVVKMFVKATVCNSKIPFNIKESVLNEMIIERKEKLAHDYKTEINIVLSRYSEDKRDEIYDKILEDIYNIKCVSNLSIKEYFELSLYRFPKEEWAATYLSDEDTKTIIRRLNERVPGIDMGNKYVCYEQLKRFYKRDAMCLHKPEDKYEFVFFVKKHGRVLLKPNRGSLGNGIELLRYEDVTDWDKYVSDKLVESKAGFIVEEVITQDSDMAVFNPSSVNTLRVTTLRMDDEIHAHVFMRVGANGSIVDNAAKGGFICKLNRDTGEILEVFNTKGERFEYHPDTNVKIVGKYVPAIEKAIRMAKEAAKAMPHYRYIGFDFAKVNDQWVMIEFNNRSGIVGVQSTLDRGLKQAFMKVFEKLGKDVDF